MRVTLQRGWLVRGGWAAVAFLTAALLLSFLGQGPGWPVSAGLLVMLVLSAVRPYPALLLVAALGPLAAILFALAGGQPSGFRLPEAMILALLAGWSAGRAARPLPLAVSPATRWSAALLALTALASAIVSAAVLVVEQSVPGIMGTPLAQVIGAYALDVTPVSLALLMFEGLLLLLAAADICGGVTEKRDGVLRMMIVAAAAAAVFNVLRIVLVAVQREQSWDVFVAYLVSLRVNVHYLDLNAAGSYFAMTLLMAFALTLRSRARWPAVVCIILLAAGLWISGSRTALAAVCLIAAMATVFRMRARSSGRVLPFLTGAAILAAVAAAAWVWYPHGRNLDAGPAFLYRLEMARAALRLTASDPLFGVGIGWFHSLSGHRENAHNNFLQILAELGVPGLLLFLSTILFSIRESVRSANPPWALLAGIGAFLLTCIGGHPLLVPEASYPFWMALGLAATTSRPVTALRPRVSLAAVGLIIAFAADVPFRAAAAMGRANLGNQSSGLSKWQRDADGARYRWAGGQASFFVDSSARSVRIPLKHTLEETGPLEIRIFLNGREANRILLQPGGEWQVARLILPRDEQRSFSRIDLSAGVPGTLIPVGLEPSDVGGVMMVGRPIIEH